MKTEAQKFTEALQAFKAAADNLNEVWGSLQWVNENGAELAETPNKLYPFATSFDELTHDIKLWVEDTTESIKRFKPANQ